MTSFDGLLITLMIFGGILFVVSFFAIRNMRKRMDDEKKPATGEEDFVYEEVRNKILELNEYGEYLKSELDGKHKELLFLYQMVSEKEKEIQKNGEQTDKIEQMDDVEMEEQDGDVSQLVNKNIISPKEIEEFKEIHYNKKILDLSLEGYSNQEIAKRLNIGTGQVELVLNLFK